MPGDQQDRGRVAPIPIIWPMQSTWPLSVGKGSLDFVAALATNQKRTPPCYGLPRLVQPSGDLGDDRRLLQRQTSLPAAAAPAALFTRNQQRVTLPLWAATGTISRLGRTSCCCCLSGREQHNEPRNGLRMGPVPNCLFDIDTLLGQMESCFVP